MDTLMRKIKPNACPICGGPLHLYELERISFDLSTNGQKTDVREDFFECKIACDVCKTEFDADKRGTHYFIKRKLPEVKFEIKTYNPFMLYSD